MRVYAACALARRACARARSCTCEPTLGVEGSVPFSGTATTSRFEVHQIYAGLLNAREAPTPVCGFRGGHGASDDFRNRWLNTTPSPNDVVFHPFLPPSLLRPLSSAAMQCRLRFVIIVFFRKSLIRAKSGISNLSRIYVSSLTNSEIL